MSKSLKGLLVLALAGAAANSAMAADGQISFTGKVIASACTVDDGGGNQVKPDIQVNMGTVTVDSISNTPDGTNFTSVQNITMNLQCGEAAGATKLHMYFRPSEGAGTGANSDGTLKVTGGAVNVAIALLDGNNQKIDLNNPNSYALADLTPPVAPATTHTANLSLGAAYVKTGAITAGGANAVLPFVLEYH